MIFQKPNWEHWSNLDQARVYELVALSLELDPNQHEFLDQIAKYKERIDLARRFVGTRRPLKPIEPNQSFYDEIFHLVTVSDFRGWVESLNPPWQLPEQFPKAERKVIGNGIETLNRPGHPNYAEELEIAIKAWSELCADKQKKPIGGWVPHIKRWVLKNHKQTSISGAERIATMINPQRQGGATPTPDKKT